MIEDDIKAFRNNHFVERRESIKDLAEADKVLEDNPLDASALQYLGWHLLQAQTRIYSDDEDAISYLRTSVTSGILRVC